MANPSLSADVPDGVLLSTPEVWNAWLKKTDPRPDYFIAKSSYVKRVQERDFGNLSPFFRLQVTASSFQV